MKKTKTDDLVEYAIDFLEDYDRSLFISEYGTISQIMDELEEISDYVDVLDKTNGESEMDDLVYIEKLSDDVYIVRDLFDEDGEIISEVGADYVLIEDGLLLEDIINDYIYADEELTMVAYENNENEMCDCCKECLEHKNCNCQELNGEEDKDSYYENLEENEKEFIDEIAEDTGYSKEILAEAFIMGICLCLNRILED